MIILVIALLGSIGALVRFHFGGYVHSSLNRVLSSEANFPFGTLFVNALGSLLLGFSAGLFSQQIIPHILSAAIGVGFCGSLTTFSTLAVDLQRFLRDRRFGIFALYFAASAFSGIGAVLLGLGMAGFVR